MTRRNGPIVRAAEDGVRLRLETRLPRAEADAARAALDAMGGPSDVLRRVLRWLIGRGPAVRRGKVGGP